jgi:hypothetical protein
VFQLPAPVDDGVRGARWKRAIPLPVARADRRLIEQAGGGSSKRCP